MKKIIKLDFISLGGVALGVIGILLEVLGGFIIKPLPSMGINTDLHALVYVSLAIVILGLLTTIAGRILCKKLQTNKVICIASLQICIVLVLLAIGILAMIVLWALINPANG